MSDETKGSTDIAKWAFNVVSTRSIERGEEGSGDLVIVPMADMVSLINKQLFTNYIACTFLKFLKSSTLT